MWMNRLMAETSFSSEYYKDKEKDQIIPLLEPT